MAADQLTLSYKQLKLITDQLTPSDRELYYIKLGKSLIFVDDFSSIRIYRKLKDPEEVRGWVEGGMVGLSIVWVS